MQWIRCWLARLYGAYAIVTFSATALTTCVLVVLCPGQENRRRIGGAGVRLALRFIGIPFKVRGHEHLPVGPCIVVANHASYLDGLVLTAALPPRFSFVIKAEAGRVPALGLLLRRMGAAFVTRADAHRASLETRRLIRGITAGASLAIFPEGTFSTRSEMLPFRLGAFVIAARAGAPVVPVAIHGTRHVLPDVCCLPRRGCIRVELLAPLLPNADQDDTAACLRDRAYGAVHQQLVGS